MGDRGSRATNSSKTPRAAAGQRELLGMQPYGSIPTRFQPFLQPQSSPGPSTAPGEAVCGCRARQGRMWVEKGLSALFLI